jgi:hypothetical protein
MTDSRIKSGLVFAVILPAGIFLGLRLLRYRRLSALPTSVFGLMCVCLATRSSSSRLGATGKGSYNLGFLLIHRNARRPDMRDYHKNI